MKSPSLSVPVDKMSLFGGLFEDEAEQDEGNAGSAVRFDRDNIPPPPRLSSGLCGIYNQGATCYLNSLLQTLLMTPEFRGIISFDI